MTSRDVGHDPFNELHDALGVVVAHQASIWVFSIMTRQTPVNQHRSTLQSVFEVTFRHWSRAIVSWAMTSCTALSAPPVACGLYAGFQDYELHLHELGLSSSLEHHPSVSNKIDIVTHSLDHPSVR